MADKLKDYSTSKYSRDQMGQVIDDFTTQVTSARRSFERRWYDNNFFDDGFHFRFMSRTQNKIVDISNTANIYNPLRAIPKASRQIRGVANLLVSQDPIPVVYPEKVSKVEYPPITQQDPTTGQPVQVPSPEYLQAMDLSRKTAKKIGHWITEEFKEQEILEKLAQMVILTAKNGVSYLKIWPDAIDEKINTVVKDAFDIFLNGDEIEIENVPFIIESSKKTIAWIKANEMFDETQKQKISPDNRHASSEIKEAYMSARHGRGMGQDQSITLILKEAFIKEYLDDSNRARIKMQEDADQILKDRKDGDVVMRHTFSAGGVWLKDEYIKQTTYPYVDFRLEPGSIYQVPLIERFIPQNKSYDMLISRGERITHASTTGILMRQKGQSFTVSNESGAQIVDYEGVKPEWLGMPSLPNSYWNMLGIVQQNIEEQGVSTTTLGKLPSGVRSGTAIESLKESEYANLVIASRRYKNTVKRIAERFMDLADEYFVVPQEVAVLEKGEPTYFDIVGNQAFKQAERLREENPFLGRDIIPIKKEYHVEIEIESQLGYTQEGKKQAAKDLFGFVVQMMNIQPPPIPPQAVAEMLKTLLKAYQFGSTEELMDAIDDYLNSGAQQAVDDESIDKMKLAMLQVLKDVQGTDVMPNQEQRIDEGKVATAEVLSDLQKGGVSSEG